jgi:CheY-like chemotaxis protein
LDRWPEIKEKQEKTVMKQDGKPITILVADDDPDDRILIQDALTESRLANDVRFVEDGEELMDYLLHRHKYADAASAPSPGLILLDLNMPRKDGREAIREIKADAQLKFIPIVVLTTSRAEEDIYKTYNLGVSSFITKPVTFESFVELMRLLGRYWFEIVELPMENSNKKYGMLYREGTAR